MRKVGVPSKLLAILALLAGSALLVTGCSSGPNEDTSSIKDAVKKSADANKPVPGDTGGTRG